MPLADDPFGASGLGPNVASACMFLQLRPSAKGERPVHATSTRRPRDDHATSTRRPRDQPQPHDRRSCNAVSAQRSRCTAIALLQSSAIAAQLQLLPCPPRPAPLAAWLSKFCEEIECVLTRFDLRTMKREHSGDPQLVRMLQRAVVSLGLCGTSYFPSRVGVHSWWEITCATRRHTMLLICLLLRL